jgi:hypothetical protein
VKLGLLLAAIVGVGLLIASGNITFDYSFSSGPQASASDEPRSQTVRDVFAVFAAATPDSADLDNAQINALASRVHSDRDRAATRLFERELPSLARRLDRKLDRLSRRVAKTPVETQVGRKCRAVTLRFLDRQRHTFRTFARGIARRGATPAAIDRHVERWGRISAWYATQLRSCAAGAAPADRAAIDAAIG